MKEGKHTGTMIAKSTDVVGFLKHQHAEVRNLFGQVLAENGEARERTFVTLRRMLAVHETAEEEVVHPFARRALGNGEEVVNARLAEENEAKKVLASLEKMPVDSAEFEATFRELQAAVLQHAEAEETQEFAYLSGEVDQDKLDSMRKAVEFAESVAPTRPHAGVESAGANMLAGPFASMVDRVRDAISGKTGAR